MKSEETIFCIVQKSVIICYYVLLSVSVPEQSSLRFDSPSGSAMLAGVAGVMVQKTYV